MNSKFRFPIFFVGILGLAYLVSGALIFFFPLFFYEILGNYYGPFSEHFIKDSGLAFSASGMLLLYRSKSSLHLTIHTKASGNLFLLFHSLFHLEMLLRDHHPWNPFFELFIIILPPFLILLLILQARRSVL